LRAAKRSAGKFRVAIQDVYTIDNRKIGGARVEAGSVRRGMQVMVEPDHVELRLSEIPNIRIRLSRQGVEIALVL